MQLSQDVPFKFPTVTSWGQTHFWSQHNNHHCYQKFSVCRKPVNPTFSLSLVTFELTEPRASLLTCLDMCGGGVAILMSVCGRAPDQNAERVSRPWASWAGWRCPSPSPRRLVWAGRGRERPPQPPSAAAGDSRQSLENINFKTFSFSWNIIFLFWFFSSPFS